MAPVKIFGRRGAFPRVGAWTTVNGKLGVIFAITDGVAEVHGVDDNGETTDTVKVPVDQLTIASHADFAHLARTGHLSPFDAAVMGYSISDEQLKALTALQRKRLNRSLDDQDAAQGLIEESEEHMAQLKRDRVAKHPEAIALEAQIETERQAFVASVEARRQAMFDKLSAPKQ